MIIAVASVFATLSGVGSAQAATFVRTVTFEELTNTSQSSIFDFDTEFESINSVTISVDPCLIYQQGCQDGFGIAEILDLGFGAQTFSFFRGFTPEGKSFGGTLRLSDENIADLLDGFIAFTAGVRFPDLFDIVEARVSAISLALTIEGVALGEAGADEEIFATPLPAGAPLFLAGLAGVGALVRRRAKRPTFIR